MFLNVAAQKNLNHFHCKKNLHYFFNWGRRTQTGYKKARTVTRFLKTKLSFMIKP